MRIWLVSAILLTAALAGCAGEETGPPDSGVDGDGSTGDGNETATSTSGSTTSSSTTTSTGSGTQAPAPNTAPTADLTADVVNGTAPLNVTFTLDGSDADGDDLTWTLVVNGTEVANGTELPATVVHEFTAAGTFIARLQVSDADASTQSVLNITAIAADPVRQEFDGEWIAETPTEFQGASTLLPQDVVFADELDGITYVGGSVDAATWGAPYTATFGCSALLQWFVYFHDADGNVLERTNWAECVVQGTVPDGAATMRFTSAGGGDSVAYLATTVA